MLFLLIFPVLVAGFLACHTHPIHSYKLHRYEGQYLYLKSAELGLKCFAIAFALALATHYWFPDSVTAGSSTVNSGMDQDVSIMPLMSGYRDKDTLKVSFTTHYEEVDADIYLSLRQDAIVSATEFDFGAYQKWNPPKAVPPASPPSTEVPEST